MTFNIGHHAVPFKCDFLYSYATVDKISNEILHRSSPLRYLSFLFVDIITDSTVDVLNPSAGEFAFICFIVICVWTLYIYYTFFISNLSCICVCTCTEFSVVFTVHICVAFSIALENDGFDIC